MKLFVKRLVFELSTVGLAFLLWWAAMSDDVGLPPERFARGEMGYSRCSNNGSSTWPGQPRLMLDMPDVAAACHSRGARSDGR